jgi:predicted neutral ceramidase superfamily lipid hydrolase
MFDMPNIALFIDRGALSNAASVQRLYIMMIVAKRLIATPIIPKSLPYFVNFKFLIGFIVVSFATIVLSETGATCFTSSVYANL